MSRLDSVKIKYPKINWNIAKTYDPSKNFKYLDWIGKNKAKPEIKDLLSTFERKVSSLKEKDINKYDLKSLKKALEDLAPSRKEAKSTDVIEYDSNIPGVKLYELVKFKGSQPYMAGTKWCISKEDVFDDYVNNLSKIFVAIKDNYKIALSTECYSINEKLQWVLCSIYDSKDVELDENQIKELGTFSVINEITKKVTEIINQKYLDKANDYFIINNFIHYPNLKIFKKIKDINNLVIEINKKEKFYKGIFFFIKENFNNTKVQKLFKLLDLETKTKIFKHEKSCLKNGFFHDYCYCNYYIKTITLKTFLKSFKLIK